MKCLKMKVSDVLLFVNNLITIYSLKVSQHVSASQSTTLLDGGSLKSKFNKDCPQLLGILRENNLTDHIFDCNMLEIKTATENGENLLQQTCFFVIKVLSVMCEKKLTVTPDLFKLDKVHFICPLNFSHLQQLNLFRFSNYESVKKLTNKDDCSELCSGTIRTQCVVLNQLNNYFGQLTKIEKYSTDSKQTKLMIQNNENEMVTKKQEKEQHLPKSITKVKLTQDEVPLEVDRILTSPDQNKLIPNTENNSITKKEEKGQYLPESKANKILSKSKNETRLNKVVVTHSNITKSTKEQKTEKITSTPSEEPVHQSEIKEVENDNTVTGDEEFEDQNEDLPNEGAGAVDDSLSEKFPLERVDKISTSLPKGKEIYPAEGFFQAEDSHFFFYFIMVSSIIVVCYLAFHNKNKILAYALEGTSGRRSRRRPNRARYRKLETNLEEVISSNTTNSAVSSVVY